VQLVDSNDSAFICMHNYDWLEDIHTSRGTLVSGDK
jgi:hypothetical protein